MNYIFLTWGTIEDEDGNTVKVPQTDGPSFSLPHRTKNGIISPNTAIPALRHRYSIIPCERVQVLSREERGHEVRDTGETVTFTEIVPATDENGNTKTDDDGKVIYENVDHEYPELIATEKYYVPTAGEQLGAELRAKVLEYVETLQALGIATIPESWEETIQVAEEEGVTERDALRLYILWKEELQPHETLIRQWLAELQEE